MLLPPGLAAVNCISASMSLLPILVLSLLQAGASSASEKPNFIVIFADDVGYGDFQCYGHPTQERGPIDDMAEEGMRFTNWYSADSMCSPSRSALLTGRLPIRIGVVGPNRVFWQWDAEGLPKSEKTIPEALKELGYATGMVGKWHLGINEKVVNDGNHLPTHHGFDFVGTNYPYGQNYKCDPSKFNTEEMSVKCFKYQNKTMIQQPTTMVGSTAEMVENITTFIEQNSENPFFFYFPLLQTHCSLFCSEPFCGSSKRGLYGDNINEMSWAVGQVLDALKYHAIDDKTLVFFTSDNGPQLEMCTYGGSSGFLKGGKTSTWEGGIRMPAIAWWPGTIPAGTVTDEIVNTMDIYSTIMELAGASTDDGIYRDSKSIVGVLKNETISPHDFLFHYCSDRLMAVRHKSFKVHYVTQTITMDLSKLCVEGVAIDDALTNLPCYGDDVVAHDPPLIFNVNEDPGEDYPLNPDDYSDLLAKVEDAVKSHSGTIVAVDSLLGKKDEALQPCCNPPDDCECNYESTLVHGEL